jgi:hypothetical protein
MAENIVKSWFVESFDRRVIEKIDVFFLVRHMHWRATPPPNDFFFGHSVYYLRNR